MKIEIKPICNKSCMLSAVSGGVLLLISMFLVAPVVYAEIYKWTDEKGRVHFGDRKLKQVPQERVELEVQKTDWKRFDISVTPIDLSFTDDELERIQVDINAVYEFYDRVMHFDFFKTVPVSITVLRDKDSYHRYLMSNYQVSGRSSLGVYLSKENEVVVYVEAEDEERVFRTIKHETSHAIIDTVTPYAPTWLNEGLAEQMETLSRESGRLFIHPHRANRYYVEKQHRAGALLSAEIMLKMPSREWRNHLSHNGSIQSQAGQLVNMFLNTAPDKSFVVRLLHKFERGDRTLSFYLVDKNYIGGIKTLEQNWKRWAKKPAAGIITL
jgi:Domain of unknown function (DUF4124)